MKLLVTDTNVFIDILRLDRCHEFFSLKQEVHTTQFVIHELKSSQKVELKPFIDSNKLVVKSFDSSEVVDLMGMEITRRNVAKRIADRSVLFYALNETGVLISGDKNLKSEAEEKGLEAHGTIWIVSEMYSQGVIGLTETIEVLERLKTINQYLPTEEINLILKKIRVK